MHTLGECSGGSMIFVHFCCNKDDNICNPMHELMHAKSQKGEWGKKKSPPHWKALQKIGKKYFLFSFDKEPYLRIFPMVGFLLLLLGFQFYEERWCLVRGKSCGVSHSRRQIGHHWREQNIIQKNLKKINQIYKMIIFHDINFSLFIKYLGH